MRERNGIKAYKTPYILYVEVPDTRFRVGECTDQLNEQKADE